MTADISRGRLDDPRLPYPLTDLHATVKLDDHGVQVHNLVARNRQTTVELSLTQHGYGAQAPMTAQVNGHRMALDRQLFEALPAEYRVMWSKYAPAGEVDVDLKLTFDGRAWRPEANVQLLGSSFRYYEFPLQLERATGTVGFKENRLTLNIVAYDGADKIAITGDLHNPGPLATGWAQAEGAAIRIDEELLSAVPDNAQGIVRSLHPAGSVGVLARYWREDVKSPEQNYVRLDLKNCSIRVDDFPYPLNNVRGVAEMTNGQWTFHDFHGDNDTGRFTCRGTLSTSLQQDVLQLAIAATEAPLEEELRDALEPRVQRLWNGLRPRGAVNFSGQVRYTNPGEQLHVWARIEPHGETASIEPTAFPYRLENLRGAVVYEDGHVDLQNLRATHGRTTVAAGGRCDVTPDGGWRLQLANMTVDRLSADRDLTQALPKRMRQGVADMKLEGPLNLRGAVTFAQGPRPEDQVQADWDVDVVLRDNTLRAKRRWKACTGS